MRGSTQRGMGRFYKTTHFWKRQSQENSGLPTKTRLTTLGVSRILKGNVKSNSLKVPSLHMSHVTYACPEELNEARGRGRTYISGFTRENVF